VKIKTDEITSVIKQEIQNFAAQLEISEVGQVVEVGDGIARVYGLGKVMASSSSSRRRAARPSPA
jgi:F-type H+-transporting ATPase subunit alpha